MYKLWKYFLFSFCSLTLAVQASVAKDGIVKAKSEISGKTKADLAEVLEGLEKTVPLTYNQPVQRMIGIYSSQRARFAKVVGLSQYYFPIYEKVFKAHGVPEEIKYLSVVESSLNPYALSSAQAGGLWQFLEPVAKIYGLTVNDTVDERRDPVLACDAAARYLLDSYNMYGDWLLAIASYNCGRNNIRWAMEEAGGAKDYWAIRQYLPVETQNYVPAYIATVYMMNSYRKHGIYPSSPDFPIYTKDLTVNQPVSLLTIARALNVDLDELGTLNASYKTLTVNASATTPKRIVIPQIKSYIFDALVDALQKPVPLGSDLKLVYTVPSEKPAVASTPVRKVATYAAKTSFIMYRVQEGDTLNSIAEKFNGTEEEIKVINKLQHYAVKPGMLLKIIQS